MVKPDYFGTVRSSSKGIALIQFETTETVVPRGHEMAGKVIREVRPNVSLDIPGANLTNIPVNVPKHMVHYAFTDSIVRHIASDQVDNECRHTVDTVQATSTPPVQMDKRASIPSTNKDWRNTISIPPEYVAHRIQFINKLEQFQEM